MLKYALIALLRRGPRHGYELKASFEKLFGGTWPLNIGQVYSTLARLERDRLVQWKAKPQQLLPDRKVYSLTSDGRLELKRWLTEEVARPNLPRGEFFIKILLHALDGSPDGIEYLWKQRERYLQDMAELLRLRDDPSVDPSTRLIITSAVLHLEADLKWLELCEEEMSNNRSPSRSRSGGTNKRRAIDGARG